MGTDGAIISLEDAQAKPRHLVSLSECGVQTENQAHLTFLPPSFQLPPTSEPAFISPPEAEKDDIVEARLPEEPGLIESQMEERSSVELRSGQESSHRRTGPYRKTRRGGKKSRTTSPPQAL